MVFERNSSLLFVGDSITDCGRIRPTGEGEGLGNGYVAMINALTQAYSHTAGLKILNMGISGDTTRHLLKRWQTDVIDLKPDYLSIMIGINDIWRKYDSYDPAAAVGFEEYTDNLTKLVQSVKNKVGKLILLSPFFVETDRQNPMRADVDAYVSGVGAVAKENGCDFVNLQEVFDKYMADGMKPSVMSGDKVHPSFAGSMIIAKKFAETYKLL